MLALAGLGSVAPVVALSATASSPYYGRWTVAEERPVFTPRGRPYKTIDIAPCGRDFCGVSVDDKGRCGAVLFRFLGRHANSADALRSHGKWGDTQKNIEIYEADETSPAGSFSFELYLGEGRDFGGRSDSMPKFHGTYRRLGAARCIAR